MRSRSGWSARARSTIGQHKETGGQGEGGPLEISLTTLKFPSCGHINTVS